MFFSLNRGSHAASSTRRFLALLPIFWPWSCNRSRLHSFVKSSTFHPPEGAGGFSLPNKSLLIHRGFSHGPFFIFLASPHTRDRHLKRLAQARSSGELSPPTPPNERPYFAAAGTASFTLIVWSAATFSSFCVMPLGHVISTSLAFASGPSPKCTGPRLDDA